MIFFTDATQTDDVLVLKSYQTLIRIEHHYKKKKKKTNTLNKWPYGNFGIR